MTRTQIQLPEPLFGRLKKIAKGRDISVAEVIRRGMELYAETFCEELSTPHQWKMPILRGSGGHLVDPSIIRVEAEAIETKPRLALY